MIERRYGYLEPREGDAPEASRQLEQQGFALLEGAFDEAEVAALAHDIRRVFDQTPRDDRPAGEREPNHDQFRYEMLNRSAPCQRAVAKPEILAAIEPLIGGDCHVIANTAWRNPPGVEGSHGGEIWHIDAGPHVPRAAGVPWPEAIAYPVFAIGCHILLEPSRIEDGPTGVIPGSHRSGQHPPFDRIKDQSLEWEGQGCVPLVGEPGDVALFVSDVWHRRMPTRDGERGRFFLQIHYARRDIAQRLRTTSETAQVSAEAEARALSPRERTLIGLHAPGFYDG